MTVPSRSDTLHQALQHLLWLVVRPASATTFPYRRVHYVYLLVTFSIVVSVVWLTTDLVLSGRLQTGTVAAQAMVIV